MGRLPQGVASEISVSGILPPAERARSSAEWLRVTRSLKIQPVSWSSLKVNKLDRSAGTGSVEGPVMALRALFAAIIAAAVGVGLVLPVPHRSEAHARSQIELHR